MRIGYFGGTFDPPHRAHLAVALAAADDFALDRVMLAPAGHQPLKQAEPAASYADRLAMVKLLCATATGSGVALESTFAAVSSNARLEASELDAPHPDGSPNYTVDTLKTLQDQNPGAQLFCIVGADSFLSLRRWKNPDTLLQIAEWIVVSRPDFSLENLSSLGLSAAQLARIHPLTTVDDDTSATGIRERLQYGISPGGRLTPEVMLYIARMRLYHPER